MLLRSNFENILEERLIAEAPWLMYSQGYYYLFYSSAWTTEAKYHIRVAVSKKVAGPYSRGHVPVLTTDWGRYDKVCLDIISSLNIFIETSRWFSLFHSFDLLSIFDLLI